MTTIETEIKKIENIDFRTLELKLGDTVFINGKKEIVIETTFTETYYEGKRLVSFGSVRREEDGGIAELRYSINKETGKEHQDFSGIVYEEDRPPYHASERYSKLNRIFKEEEK